MAARLPGILPPLGPAEARTVTRLHSAAGTRPRSGLMVRRPFRSPHHSLTPAGLIGGGSAPRPGELSLAHHGVLFLDELTEYQSRVLDVLREPLETGRVSVARANAHVTYPARVPARGGDEPVPLRLSSRSGPACGRAPKCARITSRASGPAASTASTCISTCRR